MQLQKIIIFGIISFFCILKAENLDRMAIFPFKTDGIDGDSSFIFVELLRNEVAKSKQYEIVEYNGMKKILFEYGYKGENLWDNDESAIVMGKFLSVNNIILGFLKKKRSTITINIRFIEVKKEEIILDLVENFNGSFEELLTNRVPELAEMINWSTKDVNSVNKSKKNKRKYPLQRGGRASKFRILSGVSSLVTASSGVVTHYLVEKKKKEYDRIKKELDNEIFKDITYEQFTSINKRLEDTQKSADRGMKLRNVLYSLAVTSLIGFSITFFF